MFKFSKREIRNISIASIIIATIFVVIVSIFKPAFDINQFFNLLFSFITTAFAVLIAAYFALRNMEKSNDLQYHKNLAIVRYQIINEIFTEVDKLFKNINKFNESNESLYEYHIYCFEEMYKAVGAKTRLLTLMKESEISFDIIYKFDNDEINKISESNDNKLIRETANKMYDCLTRDIQGVIDVLLYEISTILY